MEHRQFIDVQKDRILNRIRSYETFAKGGDTAGRRLPEYHAFKIKKIIPNLQAVLSRIRVGRYGLCADCCRQIPRKRLEVIPGAIRCVSCQVIQEAL